MSKTNSNQVFVEVTNSRLPVWKYFKKSVDGSSDKCKLCNAIRKCTKGSPTGLHTHLKSIHKIDTKTINPSAEVRSAGDGGDNECSSENLSTQPDPSVAAATCTSSVSPSVLNSQS